MQICVNSDYTNESVVISQLVLQFLEQDLVDTEISFKSKTFQLFYILTLDSSF